MVCEVEDYNLLHNTFNIYFFLVKKLLSYIFVQPYCFMRFYFDQNMKSADSQGLHKVLMALTHILYYILATKYVSENFESAAQRKPNSTFLPLQHMTLKYYANKCLFIPDTYSTDLSRFNAVFLLYLSYLAKILHAQLLQVKLSGSIPIAPITY